MARLIRFCSDCNEQHHATIWNAVRRVRLCPSCEQINEDEAAATWTYLDDAGEVLR